MTRSTSLSQKQTVSAAVRPAGGGFALILLLAVVAAVPAATLDHAGSHNNRREAAPRDMSGVRAISGSLARAVRDLVAGGSVIAAVTQEIAAMAPEAPEAIKPHARLSGERPHATPSRPELLNIPPPAA